MTTALDDSKKLANLIYDLEQGRHPLRFESENFYTIVMNSKMSPGRQEVFVIPKITIPDAIFNHSSKTERDKLVDKCVSELEAIQENGRQCLHHKKFFQLVVLIPGDSMAEPIDFYSNQWRINLVLFISAVQHLWLQRLCIPDRKARQTLLERSGSQWTKDEENKFIKPSK